MLITIYDSPFTIHCLLTRWETSPILLLQFIQQEGVITVKKSLLFILFVAFLSLAFGGAVLAQTGNGHAEPPNMGGLFSDVPKDHWAYNDLEYLAERGIITGLPGGQYNGEQALDRYSAAALIARAIKYMQNNPESVTPEDLDVLRSLIFKVSDNLATLQSQIGSMQGGDTSALESRVSQNEQAISQLRTQAGTGTDSTQLASRVNANFIISLTALLVGIIGVALATFR